MGYEKKYDTPYAKCKDTANSEFQEWISKLQFSHHPPRMEKVSLKYLVKNVSVVISSIYDASWLWDPYGDVVCVRYTQLQSTSQLS